MNIMCGIEQHFQRPSAFRRIPTGFRPKAQGCESRATLGNRHHGIYNPVGVGNSVVTVSQGSSCLATLGFGPESRWDSCALLDELDEVALLGVGEVVGDFAGHKSYYLIHYPIGGVIT